MRQIILRNKTDLVGKYVSKIQTSLITNRLHSTRVAFHKVKEVCTVRIINIILHRQFFVAQSLYD